jgi:DNA repair protein RadA
LGHTFTLRDASSRMSGYGLLSTGSSGIDSLLGGGLKIGRVLEVFGESKSGKSQLAMQAAACAAQAGHSAVYVDTEGAFRPERVAQIGEARGFESGFMDRILYVRAKSSAEQLEIVSGLGSRAETRDCRLVVVDTLTRHFTLDYSGRTNMKARQGALDFHLGEILRDAFLNGRAYLLTNRVTFSYGGQIVHIGGSTVSQLAHLSLKLLREEGGIRVEEIASGRSALCRLGVAGIE